MLVLSDAGRGERMWPAATEASLLRSAAKPASQHDHVRDTHR